MRKIKVRNRITEDYRSNKIRFERENKEIRKILLVYLEVEKKLFNKNKVNFVRFHAHTKKGKVRDTAIAIQNYILNFIGKHSNSPEQVLKFYFESLFKAFGKQYDFWQFRPNSYSISKFMSAIEQLEEDDMQPFLKEDPNFYNPPESDNSFIDNFNKTFCSDLLTVNSKGEVIS